jgi:hypothetical protein
MAHMDDVLITIIVAGIGLSVAYLRAELVLHRRTTALQRAKELVQHNEERIVGRDATTDGVPHVFVSQRISAASCF